MANLPAYLLPVLQLKVQGLTNHAIADKLNLTPSTVDTYTKRIIQFFKDEGIWDPHLSSKIGLMVCGRHYLANHVAASSLDLLDATAISQANEPHHIVKERVEQLRVWADLLPEHLGEALKKLSPNPYEVGTLAFLLGNRFYRDWLCTEAIQVFQLAEQILGSITHQAAQAACSRAQMYLELGDLQQAKAQITQAECSYAAVADLETQIEMQHIHGWADYYQGNLYQAEGWYRESLTLVEQKGIEHLGKHAHHFLGCIYTNLGELSECAQAAAEWFHQAEQHLDEACRLHRTWGDDGDKGYDLLRKAQLRRVQRRWQEAQQLRAEARHFFGTNIYVLDIEQEEAEVCLRNNEAKIALHKAETALEGWSEVKRAKAIADALRTIGAVKCRQGKTQQSLELYLASLCVYPYENFPDNRQLWSTIKTLLSQVDDTPTQKRLQTILESLEERRGPFAYLKHITIDRSNEIARLLQNLTE